MGYKMKIGQPWLYDELTGDIVGVKDADGGESFFARMSADGTQGLVDPSTGRPSNVARSYAYRGFYRERPLQHVMVPAGTAAINESTVTGATVTRSIDAVTVFNGRPTTKCVIGAGASSPNLEVGTSGATINLDAEAQQALARGFLLAIQTDGANTVSSVTLYVGDNGYSNFHTFGLGLVDTVDGWALFGKSTVGATSTTGSPNLTAAVRAKARIICSSNIAPGTIWVGAAYVVPRPRPTVVFTCDDGYDEWVWLSNEASRRGVPLSFGIAKDYIGTAGFLTQSEMLGIANHGSGLFELTNHARINSSYATLGLATYKAHVDECRDWLIGLGCDPVAARLHQYVQGSFDQALINALKADGYLAAREVGASNRRADTLPIAITGVASNYLFQAPATCNLENSQTLNTVQGYIQSAAELGSAFIMGHRFEASAGPVTWIAGYDESYGVLNLLDWLAYQRDVNGWRLLKWSEWWREVTSSGTPVLLS